MFFLNKNRFKKLIFVVFILAFFSYIFVWTNREEATIKAVYYEETNELNHKLVKKSNSIVKDPKEDLAKLRIQVENDLNILDYQLRLTKDILTNVDSELKNVEKQQREIEQENKKYLIVEYTKVFFEPKFCNSQSEDIFNSELQSCEYKNCFYTCDKQKNTVDSADALIFHQRDLEAEFEFKFNKNLGAWLNATDQLPYKSTNDKFKHSPDQVWLLWNDESTPIDPEFNKISHFFNWTMSYKTDAEVYSGSYGFFKKNTNINTEFVVSVKKGIYNNLFKVRQNGILWFVSNCQSRTRINIALELSRNYPVHVYGKCDILEGMNPKEVSVQYPLLTRNNLSECPRNSECEVNLLNSYKYYLAFESRNCSDYITEKLWRSLGMNIIPIVFQPDKESYSRYLVPKESIIHLQDFDYNTKLLAMHLKSIDQDFEAYYNILKWTIVYMTPVFENKAVEPHRMCQLCKKLNTYKSRIFYKDLARFFNGKCYD